VKLFGGGGLLGRLGLFGGFRRFVFVGGSGRLGGCGFGHYGRLGGEVEKHALAFQLGQLLYFGQFLKGLGKLEQQNFAALLEDDATAHECT
jgi:hypothetical protein